MFGSMSARRFELCGVLVLLIWPANFCLAQQSRAPMAAGVTVTSLADLKRLNEHQLRQLYAGAQPGTRPVGYMRGEVLYLDNTLLPRSKIVTAGVIWRGKHFDDKDGFVNQWTAFRAIASHTQVGPSYFDGRPCLILEYSQFIPYFGKMRDEIREVAPGVYLSMVFEKSASPRFRGFIGLELEPQKSHGTLPLRSSIP